MLCKSRLANINIINKEITSRYEYDTDHLFAQLNIVSAAQSDKEIVYGIINWFAVHPVSMNNTNHLISSDNKGAAGIFLERAVNGREAPLGKVGGCHLPY